VLLLSILTRHEPEIPATQRVRVTTLSNGFSKIIAACGYMESPDITEILKCCESAGLVINPGTVSFYLGRETILPNGDTPMAQWRKKLFIFFSRNARPATEYFKIPADQVIEIGVQVRI
jgi:KUP system potassium uptake protein